MFIGLSKREFVEAVVSAVTIVGAGYLFSVGFLLIF